MSEEPDDATEAAESEESEGDDVEAEKTSTVGCVYMEIRFGCSYV